MSDKLRDAIQRGIEADHILQSMFFKDSFKLMEAELMRQWGNTTAEETAARERLWIAVQMVGEFKKIFTSAVSDGKIARADLERLAGLNRAA